MKHYFSKIIKFHESKTVSEIGSLYLTTVLVKLSPYLPELVQRKISFEMVLNS